MSFRYMPMSQLRALERAYRRKVKQLNEANTPRKRFDGACDLTMYELIVAHMEIRMAWGE